MGIPNSKNDLVFLHIINKRQKQWSFFVWSQKLNPQSRIQLVITMKNPEIQRHRERERENSLPATPAASLQITRTVDETERIIKKPSTPTLSMQSSNQTKAPNHKNPNLISQSRSHPTFQIPSPSCLSLSLRKPELFLSPQPCLSLS